MMIVADVVVGIVIFNFGFFMGYMARTWLSKKNLSGTIYVTHEEEKTLYSLELSDYPETLEFKKEVVFKVNSPPDRE